MVFVLAVMMMSRLPHPRVMLSRMTNKQALGSSSSSRSHEQSSKAARGCTAGRNEIKARSPRSNIASRDAAASESDDLIADEPEFVRVRLGARVGFGLIVLL